MLIRCEKCNTLYELDEKLLPPTGAPVQCSKCQFVFKAYPGPREDLAPANAAIAPGEDAAPVEIAEPERGSGDQAAEPPPVEGEPARVSGVIGSAPPATGRREAAAAGDVGGARQGQSSKRPASSAVSAPGLDEPQFTADGRPIRKVPFPTEEPAAPTGPRPALGRVPGRPTAASGQRRWALVVVPVALAILLVAAFVAWRILGRRSETAAPRRAEGHSLLFPAGGRAPRVGVASSVAWPSAGTTAAAGVAWPGGPA